MPALIASAPVQPRRLGRSILAGVVPFVVNVVLSLGTDQLLHMRGVYPPWGQPMYATSLNVLALSYRIVFGIMSGYLVARLAPYSPMKHVAVLGGIAVAISALGISAALTLDLGPIWYPIALTVLAYPTMWLGALLHERSRR